MKKGKKIKRKTLRHINRGIIIFLLGVCAGIHRNVIKAFLTGTEMPDAPEWHCWVKR